MKKSDDVVVVTEFLKKDRKDGESMYLEVIPYNKVVIDKRFRLGLSYQRRQHHSVDEWASKKQQQPPGSLKKGECVDLVGSEQYLFFIRNHLYIYMRSP